MNNAQRLVGVAMVAGSSIIFSGAGRVQPVDSGPIETAASVAHTFGGEKYYARASQDSVLSFVMPAAEISEVMVKGGMPVKKGDVLVRARDEEYRLQVELQTLIAESDLEVQAREAAAAQAKVEFDAQTRIKEQSGGSTVDYDRARTTLRVREVELEVAKLNRRQQALQLKLQQSRLDRFTLQAPFDGIVDAVSADLGEIKKETDPIVRVVDIDPLWIDVPAPTIQTIVLGLKPGAPAWVLLDLPGEPKVYLGKVIEVGAEADSSSGTRRVRVELDNPSAWPSGLSAWVRFTEPTGEWATRVVKAEPAAAARADAGDTR